MLVFYCVFLIVPIACQSDTCTCPAEAPSCSMYGDDPRNPGYCYPASSCNATLKSGASGCSGTHSSTCTYSFLGLGIGIRGTCDASYTAECPSSYPMCLDSKGVPIGYDKSTSPFGTKCSAVALRPLAECTLCCWPSDPGPESCSFGTVNVSGLMNWGPDCSSSDGACASIISLSEFDYVSKASCDSGMQKCGGAVVTSSIPKTCTAHANGYGGNLAPNGPAFEAPNPPPAPLLEPPLPPNPPPGTGFIGTSLFMEPACATTVLGTLPGDIFQGLYDRTCSDATLNFEQAYLCGPNGNNFESYFCGVLCTSSGVSIQRYSVSSVDPGSCSPDGTPQTFSLRTCITSANYVFTSLKSMQINYCHSPWTMPPLPPPPPAGQPLPPSWTMPPLSQPLLWQPQPTPPSLSPHQPPSGSSCTHAPPGYDQTCDITIASSSTLITINGIGYSCCCDGPHAGNICHECLPQTCHASSQPSPPPPPLGPSLHGSPPNWSLLTQPLPPSAVPAPPIYFTIHSSSTGRPPVGAELGIAIGASVFLLLATIGGVLIYRRRQAILISNALLVEARGRPDKECLQLVEVVGTSGL